MLVDLPRRWRWALGACCALLVAIALLFVMSATRRAEADVAPGVPVVNEAPLLEGVTPVAVAEPSADTVTPEGPARGADEIQVCGGAWVKANPDGSFDQTEFERATQLPAMRARVLTNMQASGSEFARASALLLEMLHTEDQRHIAGALARLAVSTRDAKVYALAFKACATKRPGESACQLLSAEQWARLDPDNAGPWKFVLQEAQSRGDLAARDDALFHIANARRNETGFFSVPAAILDAVPDDDASRLAALILLTDAIGFEAGSSIAGLQAVNAFCREPWLRDTSRAQTCASVAELLVERSDTLLDARIGAALGTRLGWPADRGDRMRAEYTAYTEQVAAASGDGNEFGCTAVEHQIALVRRRVALGEVGAMREWVAASGKRPEDFVLEDRLRQQRWSAAAALAAASAGSAVASD